MTEQEEWRAVVGYEGFYEVSDLGRVRGLDRTVVDRRGGVKSYRGRIIKPWLTLGYVYITLCREGVQKRKRVHILVAEAFIGPRPEGMTDVRHLDGVPTNNVPANLAYGTRSDNMRDAVEHGTNYFASRTHCKQGHEFTPENTEHRIQKKNGRPARQCRACHLNASREQNRKLREAKRSVA